MVVAVGVCLRDDDGIGCTEELRRQNSENPLAEAGAEIPEVRRRVLSAVQVRAVRTRESAEVVVEGFSLTIMTMCSILPAI